MTKIRALVVLGTRPEMIKLAPVIRELEQQQDTFEPFVCATAQHRTLLDQAASAFRTSIDYDLDIMKPNQSLAEVTANALRGLNDVVEDVKPDVILVQGDTTSAMCGALAGYYHQVKVGHVEAGLRTGNKYAPFPEEINRRLIAQLADLHFAPTEKARDALMAEHVIGKVFVTGNTVIDSLLWIREKVTKNPPHDVMPLINRIKGKLVVLVTGHRRESFGQGFENICQAIISVAERYENVIFVYPVHLNPNVQRPVKQILGDHPHVILLGPLEYESFVWLMDHADIVLTDSGGVQEEAPSLGKPVLVMRETTERPEGIEAGNARLVGVDREKIISNLIDLIEHPEVRDEMGRINNPYGDGKASQRIVRLIAQEILGMNETV